MKNNTRNVSRLNRILRIVIVLLVLLLIGYAVKCHMETKKMKAELSDMHQQVDMQAAENQEVQNYLENSEYYLEQQARGENDYSDPQEDVYVVVS